MAKFGFLYLNGLVEMETLYRRRSERAEYRDTDVMLSNKSESDDAYEYLIRKWYKIETSNKKSANLAHLSFHQYVT